MSRIPYTDWKEWATKRPDWMQQDMATTFERFIEKKWQDALNVAAAEPMHWSVGREKPTPGGEAPDRATTGGKGVLRITGAVNVVGKEASPRSHSPPWDVSIGRKCRARNLIECEGDHVLLQCNKLLSMGLKERKEVLEKSGLCLFCLKHAAELECYGRGGLSKPRCTQDGCDGEHTPSVHKLVGEENASVNFVTEVESDSEDEDEDENEEWWVSTVGMVDTWEDKEEASEEVGEAGSEKETYPPANSCSERGELCREGAPGSPVRDYPTWEPEDGGRWGLGAHQLASGAANEPRERRPPYPKAAKRRELKKKEKEGQDQEWEWARQDAWLREMLSDTSSSEDEESGERFAESRRWMSELFEIS
jgi:hypothetical protein